MSERDVCSSYSPSHLCKPPEGERNDSDSKKRKPADKETRNQKPQNAHQLKVNGGSEREPKSQDCTSINDTISGIGLAVAVFYTIVGSENLQQKNTLRW